MVLQALVKLTDECLYSCIEPHSSTAESLAPCNLKLVVGCTDHVSVLLSVKHQQSSNAFRADRSPCFNTAPQQPIPKVGCRDLETVALRLAVITDIAAEPLPLQLGTMPVVAWEMISSIICKVLDDRLYNMDENMTPIFPALMPGVLKAMAAPNKDDRLTCLFATMLHSLNRDVSLFSDSAYGSLHSDSILGIWQLFGKQPSHF